MGYLKKILFGLFIVGLLTIPAFSTDDGFFEGLEWASAQANDELPAPDSYNLIIPQKVGGGTSVWATIVAKELEKYTDAPIKLVHLPSARDIGGFNEFHNELQSDPSNIMVSHGGNGISFLQEEVDYNYGDYASIGLMNLNIIVGKLKTLETFPDKVSFSAGSGMTPEAYAMTMLMCPPENTVHGYVACFENKITWVKGMSGGERRLAFRRGELTATRENPAAYLKHVAGNEDAEVWFHHGVMSEEGHVDDPNYLTCECQFEDLYYEKWGKKPSGDFYNAYVLLKSFRDGLQKALWVSKDNPYRDRLVEAMNQVATNPESIKAIEEKVGKYDWFTGDWGDSHRDQLMTLITQDTLRTMVTFNQNALGLKSIYKSDLVFPLEVLYR